MSTTSSRRAPKRARESARGSRRRAVHAPLPRRRSDSHQAAGAAPGVGAVPMAAIVVMAVVLVVLLGLTLFLPLREARGQGAGGQGQFELKLKHSS